MDFSVSYHPAHAQALIDGGTYPATVRTVALDDGSIFNTHFVAIPFNAPNKAGAMVVANFLLSPEAQLAKMDPAWWGDFPAIEVGRLSEEWRARFAAVKMGEATLAPDVLARRAVPEIPADWLEALERGWDAEVLRK
ncbi:Protein YnjB [anaerobic digester metagenome]